MKPQTDEVDERHADQCVRRLIFASSYLYISGMRFLRPLTATIFAASLVSISACGGSSSSTPAYSAPNDAGLVVKAVPSIRWDATEYTAAAGDIKVFFANDDSVKHILVVLKDDSVVGDLELIVNKRGDFDEGTINLEAGEYRIYCTIPGHSGMNSTLTVS
jgi:plastocyanin